MVPEGSDRNPRVLHTAFSLMESYYVSALNLVLIEIFISAILFSWRCYVRKAVSRGTEGNFSLFNVCEQSRGQRSHKPMSSLFHFFILGKFHSSQKTDCQNLV